MIFDLSDLNFLSKNKYKLSALAICLIFFALALFSSGGISPLKNVGDDLLCYWNVQSACASITSGVDWKNLKYSGNGILADEIPHIASGYYYLKTHRDFINPEHPPLVKDIAGLGESIIQPALPNITNQETLPPDFHRAEYPFINASFPRALEWQNNQDHFGTMFLFNPANNPDWTAFFARLAVIFANTILLYLLFYYLSKVWNERAALLGLFFFSISQFSIAHGSFVVIDFMSALLTGIAIVVFAIYLKKYAEMSHASRYFFLTAIFFALALVSKFSSVVLLPAAFLGGFFFVLFVKDGPLFPRILKYIFSYVAIVILALFLVSLFYVFHTYKMENDVLVKKVLENYPEEQLPATGHRILELMVYMNPLTKGLAAYINGTFMVVSRMVVSAQNTYFLGHVYGNEGAGWKYWPVLYFTKLSLGLHFFTLLAFLLIIIGLPIWKRGNWADLKNRFLVFVSNPLAILLLVFIFSYMAVTLRSTFQIGLRHIMPVILAMCLLTGKGVENFWDKFAWKPLFGTKYIFAAVAVLMLISVFWSYPYYLEYYNLLGGGTDNGYNIATDSNYDWGGSDVRRLAKWEKDNNVSEMYTQMFADVPLKYYLGDGQKYFNLQDEGHLPPSGSYLAVSVFEYMNNMYAWYIPPEHKYSILKDNLVARVGKTIFVYKIP